jgi:hypothetical protein
MNKIKMLLMILGLGTMLLCSSQAFADLIPVLTEDFQGDLSQWTGRYDVLASATGQITDGALNFTSKGLSAGVFTVETFDPGNYVLTFDYKGQDGGGFIGYTTDYGTNGTNTWLAGNADYSGGDIAPTYQSLQDQDGWYTYTISFIADTPFQLEVEDWVSPAGNAYFDNLSLVDPPSVPEPATMFLLGFGILGLVAFRKKLIKR